MNLFEWLEVFRSSSKSANKIKALLCFLVCLAASAGSAQETPEVPAEIPAEMPAEVPSSAVAEPVPSPTPEPTPEPAPAEEKKATRFNLTTARDNTYTKAVYFESMDNLLPTMELEYDLTQEGGSSLRIGDTVLNDQSFFFAIVPISKLHAKMTSVVGSREAAKNVFVMRWPENLQAGGNLEIIARTGAVLWKQEISEAQRTLWNKKLEIWKKGLEERGVKTARLPKTSVFFTQYGIVDVGTSGLKAYSESFRFCLTQAQGRAQSRLCSQRYVLRGSGGQLSLSKIKTAIPPRVLLQSQEAPLKQNVPVPRDMPTTFFAELASGESYEFIATPNKLNLMELTDTKKPDQMRIMAWGTRPTMASTITNPDEYSSFTRAIGFESTIGDMRKFWETTISTEDPKVYMPGQGGGLFTQRFELSEVPRANARPYLQIHTPVGTYDNGVKLFGKKLPEVKVTSFENSIEVDEKDPRYFLWRFKATDRGEINRSYLSMELQGKEYKAFYEVYKGFPRELSFRLSGLVAQTGNVFLGEVAYNQWFENLMGWTNYWLGRQRWGISVKYFKTLTQLSVGSGTTADLAVFNADLKYRFTPGLWGRDETVGVMLDYQGLTFQEIKAPMVGVGAFWARSMPKVFDDIFNIVPMMRYQKWVDMEFIFYPVSMSPMITLQTNFALNFHGKVLWTKNIFGEAGFGIKRYDIVDRESLQVAALNTFYGTLGLGLNF